MDGSARVREVAEWRYEPPYDFYDLASDPDDEAAMRDPARAEHCRAVLAADGERLDAFWYFDWHGDVVEVGIGLRPDLTGRGLGESFLPRPARLRRAEPGSRRRSASSSPPGTSARSGSTSGSASARSVARRGASSSSASTSSSGWSGRREGAADHRRAGGGDRRVAVRVPVRVVRHLGRPAPGRAVRESRPGGRTCGRSSATTASSSASSTSSPRATRCGSGSACART